MATNHIEGLLDFPGTVMSVSYFYYRGYYVVPNTQNISEVSIHDMEYNLITTLHTDIAIATIDSWLHAP